MYKFLKKILLILKGIFFIFLTLLTIFLVGILISKVFLLKKLDPIIPKDFFETRFSNYDSESNENGFNEYIDFINYIYLNKEDKTYLTKLIIDENEKMKGSNKIHVSDIDIREFFNCLDSFKKTQEYCYNYLENKLIDEEKEKLKNSLLYMGYSEEQVQEELLDYNYDYVKNLFKKNIILTINNSNKYIEGAKEYIDKIISKKYIIPTNTYYQNFGPVNLDYDIVYIASNLIDFSKFGLLISLNDIKNGNIDTAIDRLLYLQSFYEYIYNNSLIDNVIITDFGIMIKNNLNLLNYLLDNYNLTNEQNEKIYNYFSNNELKSGIIIEFYKSDVYFKLAENNIDYINNSIINTDQIISYYPGKDGYNSKFLFYLLNYPKKIFLSCYFKLSYILFYSKKDTIIYRQEKIYNYINELNNNPNRIDIKNNYLHRSNFLGRLFYGNIVKIDSIIKRENDNLKLRNEILKKLTSSF